MSKLQILSEFKTTMANFFDELISQFPEEGDLVIIRIFLNDQVPTQDIMEGFILQINHNDNELRKMVKNRNEKFFLEHNVFEAESDETDVLDKQKVNRFKKLWRSGRLDEDDKEMVWKWIDSFVYLSDKYSSVLASSK